MRYKPVLLPAVIAALLAAGCASSNRSYLVFNPPAGAPQESQAGPAEGWTSLTPGHADAERLEGRSTYGSTSLRRDSMLARILGVLFDR